MCVYITDAGDDKKQHDPDLHHHDDRVEVGRFLNTFDQQRGHGKGDQHCR